MMDVSEWLFQPVTVEQQTVILVPDVVGPVPVAEQHNYVNIAPATQTIPNIAVREQDVEEMRERHPDLPVYGIWQVLIASGLVSVQKTLQVLQTNAWDGYYLFSDMGRIQYSGVYEAGFFAADTSFSLPDAAPVSFYAEQLLLPPAPARLARELHDERRRRIKRSWVSCGASAVMLVVLGIGMDLSLHYATVQQHEDYVLKSRLLASAEQGLNQLRTHRLAEAPDNVEAIRRLAELWSFDPAVSTRGVQSFSQPSIQLMLADRGPSPARRFPWLSARQEPQGQWLVSFQL